MKRILLSGLILTTVGLFSNGAWARCCSDGKKLCDPIQDLVLKHAVRIKMVGSSIVLQIRKDQ